MKKATVVLLPLDERPCNFNFPKMLYKGTGLNIVQPETLGDKKNPADVDGLESFLTENCKKADYAVLAMDTLLYGGLIPSRLHKRPQAEISRRLDLLAKLKNENPKLKIYAFQCIMRCPSYSSGDEEPDYYETCGAEIHKMGILKHKTNLGMDCEYDMSDLMEKINPDDLTDFENRREFNLKQNLKTLDLVNSGVIDFLIIPQDDSAPYGYTAMDQITVRERLEELGLSHRVYIYPGADEIELTLLSRVANDLHKKTPDVFIRYASIKSQDSVPLYEDRPVGETVKYHLMAAGCIQSFNDASPDFVLALNPPPSDMKEASDQPSTDRPYCVERSMPEFIYAIDKYLERGIPVTIGDIAYANGSELALVDALNRMNRLLDLSGYAGWNTSSNTIGTSVAQAIRTMYWGTDHNFLSFLLLRYLEDAGYCASVRQKVTNDDLPSLGFNYFDVGEKQGQVSEIVKKRLLDFADQYLSSIKEHIQIDMVAQPWRRMFETEIHTTYMK